jgi:hypothetical protein
MKDYESIIDGDAHSVGSAEEYSRFRFGNQNM